MTRAAIVKRIREVGIVPVVRASSAQEALGIGDAIAAGGISILEITMTVPGAVDVIRQAAGRYGETLLVGAGTVLDANSAKECIRAGAKFIVSPIVDPATIALCHEHDTPAFPGAMTPTEIVGAWRKGADLVKVFPCGALGGASYIKSLRAPFPYIELVPTGGVTVETAGAFLKAGAAAIGVGADLCDVAALARGEASKITQKAVQYVQAVATARSTQHG